MMSARKRTSRKSVTCPLACMFPLAFGDRRRRAVAFQMPSGFFSPIARGGEGPTCGFGAWILLHEQGLLRVYSDSQGNLTAGNATPAKMRTGRACDS